MCKWTICRYFEYMNFMNKHCVATNLIIHKLQFSNSLIFLLMLNFKSVFALNIIIRIFSSFSRSRYIFYSWKWKYFWPAFQASFKCLEIKRREKKIGLDIKISLSNYASNVCVALYTILHTLHGVLKFTPLRKCVIWVKKKHFHKLRSLKGKTYHFFL